MNVFEGHAPVRPYVDNHLTVPPDGAETASLRPWDLQGPAGFALHPAWKGLSHWSRSTAKRLFDCACVLLALPVLLPLMLAIGAAVRLTSPGPVLFLQKRMGRHGQAFTILKFRTLIHVAEMAHDPNAATHLQCLTPIGPFLRRWKLDELPQLANVLAGNMSLVGPRPKLPEYVTLELPCRPGITGMATIAFAREERILARVAKEHLNAYIHALVLPAKQQLDAEYMACATFRSDLSILIKTLLCRWDTAVLEKIPGLPDDKNRTRRDPIPSAPYSGFPAAVRQGHSR
jgi:lipopolysaccharide/colanic/teichoic acid biosynthesis glycosyltransferase